MRQAKLTSKGQVTIPKQIRDYLKLHTGDQLQFIIDRTGRVVLTAQCIDIKEIFGMFNYKATRKKTRIKDMDAAIAKRMRRKFK